MHLHFLLHLAYILGPYLAVWTLFLLTMELIPHSLTADQQLAGIRSLIGFSNLAAPSPFSALPPVIYTSTLALKLFRGEPAISEFDWNFTASHSSSPVIATNVRSALHGALPPLQPDHG